MRHMDNHGSINAFKPTRRAVLSASAVAAAAVAAPLLTASASAAGDPAAISGPGQPLLPQSPEVS
jgi:hypothetical protein